jgi:hypothetical protein
VRVAGWRLRLARLGLTWFGLTRFGLTCFGAMWLAANASGCIAVEGERVLAKDLAAADPWFAQADPNLEIALSPLAGVTRVIKRRELLVLARSTEGAGTLDSISDICVERASQPLTARQLQPVLDAAMDGTPVTISEFSHYRIPHGTIEFARANLTPAGLWKGCVLYGTNHSVSIWVKLQMGSGAALKGKSREVERGARISVEVTSGAARLVFEAVAETAGRQGEWVLVRNPENGHVFQAKVFGDGKVVINK